MIETDHRPSLRGLAYGHNQPCQLSGLAEHKAELISMGGDNARLRLRAPANTLLRHGERCMLRHSITLDGESLPPTPCVVEWLNGQEAGVTFDTAQNFSVLALQQVIAQGLLAREEAA